jgi:hypothetical protein
MGLDRGDLEALVEAVNSGGAQKSAEAARQLAALSDDELRVLVEMMNDGKHSMGLPFAAVGPRAAPLIQAWLQEHLPELFRDLHDDGTALRRLAFDFCSSDLDTSAAASGRLQALSNPEIQALVARLPEDMYTVRALIQIGARALPALLAAAAERGLFWDLGYVLMRIGDSSVAPLFIRELETPDSALRELAAEALGELEAEAEIPRLRSLLDDADQDVADSAAWSLGKLGDIGSVEDICRVADASDPDRLGAICALGMLRHAHSQRELEKLLDHPAEGVRRAAADALRGSS